MLRGLLGQRAKRDCRLTARLELHAAWMEIEPKAATNAVGKSTNNKNNKTL